MQACLGASVPVPPGEFVCVCVCVCIVCIMVGCSPRVVPPATLIIRTAHFAHSACWYEFPIVLLAGYEGARGAGLLWFPSGWFIKKSNRCSIQHTNSDLFIAKSKYDILIKNFKSQKNDYLFKTNISIYISIYIYLFYIWYINLIRFKKFIYSILYYKSNVFNAGSLKKILFRS